MSIFNAPTFYSAPDRQTYSSGNFFIPQEKYTFGGLPRQVIPTGGITATTTANVLPKSVFYHLIKIAVVMVIQIL